jgi:hypothetical protein
VNPKRMAFGQVSLEGNTFSTRISCFTCTIQVPNLELYTKIQACVFSLGAKHKVKNGTSTRFWHNWWLGSPLKELYLGLGV